MTKPAAIALKWVILILLLILCYMLAPKKEHEKTASNLTLEQIERTK